MAHDVIERIARIIAPDDYLLFDRVRAGDIEREDIDPEKMAGGIDAVLLSDAREKAIEILGALRNVRNADDLPRHRSGEWSNRNIDAFVDDVVGKPLR